MNLLYSAVCFSLLTSTVEEKQERQSVSLRTINSKKKKKKKTCCVKASCHGREGGISASLFFSV